MGEQDSVARNHKRYQAHVAPRAQCKPVCISMLRNDLYVAGDSERFARAIVDDAGTGYGIESGDQAFKPWAPLGVV